MNLLLHVCKSLKSSDKLFEILSFLFDNGLKCSNETDKDGWSALMHVCNGSSPDKIRVTKLLIDMGIDINIEGNESEDALWLAINSESKGAIKLLLDNGSKIDSAVLMNCSIDTWDCCPDLGMNDICDPDIYGYIVELLRDEPRETEESQYENLIDWRLVYTLEVSCYDTRDFGNCYSGCDGISEDGKEYTYLPDVYENDWYLHKKWNGELINIYHWKTFNNPTDNAVLIETDGDTGKLTMQVGNEIVVGGCCVGHPYVYTRELAWGSSHGSSSFSYRMKRRGGVSLRCAMGILQEYLDRH